MTEHTKNYFGFTVTAWEIPNHPIPWRFKITKPCGGVIEFLGVPNYMDTRFQAFKKAWWRCKWLNEGVFEQKYR